MRKLLLGLLLPTGLMAQSMLNLSEFESTPGTEQAFIYGFTQYTSAYQDVVNPDFQVNTIWDDTTILVLNPFGQSYLGVMTDTFFTDLGATVYGINSSTLEGVIFAPAVVDLIDRGYLTGNAVSPISYVTEGASPNRIFKMEWRNAGFYEELFGPGSNNESVNIQMWLHENGNIEYHYGPSTISQAWSDTLYAYGELIVGLAKLDYNSFSISENHFLSGSPSNATMVDSIDQVTAWPSNGTVYKFTNPSVGVDEIPTIEIKLYPNPAIHELRVQADADQTFDVALIDLSGRTIKRGVMSENQPMSLTDTPAGVYLVRLTEHASGTVQTVRLVVSK